MAKTKELQANPTLQIDSINFPQSVKFWPDHPTSSPPIGGSIMFVQTKDHRLLCYRFCEANPPYWDVMAELTEIVRKKKIVEYEMHNPNIHTQADSYDFKDPVIDNAGVQFYALINSLNLIDYW